MLVMYLVSLYACDDILEDNETFQLVIDNSSLLSTIATGIPNKTVIIIRDTDSKSYIV